MPGTTNRYRNLRPGGRPFRVIPSFRALFQHRNGLFGLASRSGPFRNGTTHAYSYDTLSRPVADAVTTLGSGVDGTVRRIATGYSPLGAGYLFTSYDAASGGSVVNQVKDEFNGLGQVTKEWQEHSGAVTGTSANVQYAYSEMAGGANHSRLTSMTYASGYVLNYNYGSGLDSTISRLTSLSDSGNTLESYSYLGLATIVKRAHAQSGVDLSYIKLTGESVGDAGDQYNGLDRFQRIVDQRWINGSNVDVDRFKYGYDRNGNRLFRENVAITSLSEVYTYDDLNQLASYKLGTLNTGKTDVTGTPTNAQSWDYDAVGNWDSVTTNSTTQTRGANRQNEITSVSGATTPTYDNNGNLTKDENDNRFVWDAWNMMVQVKNSSNVVIVTMGRDALHRHVTDTEGTSLKDRFFGLKWQLFETKAGSNTVTRNVWCPVYVDAMVTRDRDTDANGTLDERLFALQDANWNTTALVNISGTVVERDTYSPFGVATYRDASGSVISTSAKDWVFLHQGGEKIAAGDYDFRNRIYSPTLGRWLSNDPIGFSAGDVNTYRYVGNGPTSLLDPMGLEDKKKWPWWWPKLIGSSNGSKAEDDEGGTYIGEIVDIRADFQHKGGAHYDVDYLEAYTGNPKVRTQRYWRDGTPFTDNENDRINRGLPAKGGNYTGVTRQNGDIRSLPFPVYGGQEIVSSPFPALRDNGMIQTPFPKFGENGKLIYDPPPIKVDPGLITPFPNEQDIGIHRESSSVNVGEYLPTPRQIVDGGIAFGSGAAIGYGILIVGGVVSAPALGPPAAIVTAGAALFFLLRGEDSFNPYDGAGGI